MSMYHFHWRCEHDLPDFPLVFEPKDCRHKAAGQDNSNQEFLSLAFVGQTRGPLLCKSADARSSLRQRQLGYLRMMREHRKPPSMQ